MKKCSISLVLAVCGVVIASASYADIVLVDDNFDRPDGSLIGTAPTPGPGSIWTNHSGNIGDLLISGGQALVQHGVPSEDAHTIFPAQSSGVLVANFDITVNDPGSPIAGGDYEYFAHFMQDGTFNFRSRLDLVPATVGGDYTLGISSGSSTAEAFLPVDFAYGVPVNVNLTFDFTAGTASVTAGGSTVNSTTVIAGATLDSFALRQSDSSLNEGILVDNLLVTIPEPSSLALVGLGALIVGLRRRLYG